MRLDVAFNPPQDDIDAPVAYCTVIVSVPD
jgi:hypothetical protein